MISDEQWNGIANTLKSRLHQPVKFRLNGQDIEVMLTRTGECELSYTVFVDGNLPVHWLEESEGFQPVCKQVCRLSVVKPYTSAINKVKKQRGGKTLLKSKEFAWVHQTQERWLPFFKSVKALVSQYRKIKGLELVTPFKDLKNE